MLPVFVAQVVHPNSTMSWTFLQQPWRTVSISPRFQTWASDGLPSKTHGVGLQFHPCQLLHRGCHSHAVTYQYSPGFTSSLVSATKQRDSVHTAGLFFFFPFFRAQMR